MKNSDLLKGAKCKKGLTLLELIIALALTIVILGVVLTFFIVSNKSIKESSIKSDLQREGKVTMELLTANIMEAKAIDKLEFTDGDDHSIKKLGLKLIKILDTDADRVEFNLKNSELKLKKLNIDQTLSTKVKSIKLLNIDKDNDVAYINENTNILKLEIIVEDKGMQYKLSNDIVLRNFDSGERK